jgi:hypothetical protein
MLNKKHPIPNQDPIESLYKYFKVSEDTLTYHRELFVDGLLYHALPSQFNDPFECKPHFKCPPSAKQVREIRKHLIKLCMNKGDTRKVAEKTIAAKMSSPNFMENVIRSTVMKSNSEVRICCFTKHQENLLLWAHYADSHKGFCLEFDAKVSPINQAKKVNYENSYPEVEYPRPRDQNGISFALTKSTDWEYEEEYRLLLLSLKNNQHSGNNKSVQLPENAIKAVYFGVNVDTTHKEKILGQINEGPFNLRIWQAQLSKSSYELDFVQESHDSS